MTNMFVTCDTHLQARRNHFQHLLSIRSVLLCPILDWNVIFKLDIPLDSQFQALKLTGLLDLAWHCNTKCERGPESRRMDLGSRSVESKAERSKCFSTPPCGCRMAAGSPK